MPIGPCIDRSKKHFFKKFSWVTGNAVKFILVFWFLTNKSKLDIYILIFQSLDLWTDFLWNLLINSFLYHVSIFIRAWRTNVFSISFIFSSTCLSSPLSWWTWILIRQFLKTKFRKNKEKYPNLYLFRMLHLILRFQLELW